MCVEKILMAIKKHLQTVNPVWRTFKSKTKINADHHEFIWNIIVYDSFIYLYTLSFDDDY